MYDEAVDWECYITFIDPRPFPIYERENPTNKYKIQIEKKEGLIRTTNATRKFVREENLFAPPWMIHQYKNTTHN